MPSAFLVSSRDSSEPLWVERVQAIDVKESWQTVILYLNSGAIRPSGVVSRQGAVSRTYIMTPCACLDPPEPTAAS